VAGYTKMVYPETVTHPSINGARRRVTTLIETNALPLSLSVELRLPNGRRWTLWVYPNSTYKVARLRHDSRHPNIMHYALRYYATCGRDLSFRAIGTIHLFAKWQLYLCVVHTTSS